jgi:uncharacterized UBP type Zn finger protein
MLSKPRYSLIIPFIITLPMTIRAELLGLNYSECIVKNLQNVESEIAAINIVSACFDEFCVKRRSILISTEYGYRSNNKDHNIINSSSQQPCNNYRDNQREIQIKSRCTDYEYEWLYEDKTCPYSIADD